MSKPIHIEIISDFACPWCFIGKRRLMKAIEQRPALDISITWHPFQLNPQMPREGMNRRDYYLNKFGEAGVTNLQQKLFNAGVEERLFFCDQPDAIAPNTLSAHVLMRWATDAENIDETSLAEKIFMTHHEACDNIGDHHVLARIAGEVGMNQTQMLARFIDKKDEEIVQKQIRQSSIRKVTSVPCFILNQQHSISGAQPTKSFTSAFDQISNTK